MIDIVNAKQSKLMLAMLTKPTMQKACEDVGVSTQTAYRWLKDETFNREFQAVKRDYMRSVTTLIQKNNKTAVNTIVGIMKDESLPPTVRLQGARTILEYGYKGLEIEDILERIDKLERIKE